MQSNEAEEKQEVGAVSGEYRAEINGNNPNHSEKHSRKDFGPN